MPPCLRTGSGGEGGIGEDDNPTVAGAGGEECVALMLEDR